MHRQRQGIFSTKPKEQEENTKPNKEEIEKESDELNKYMHPKNEKIDKNNSHVG